MKVSAEIQPGVCGLRTVVRAESPDGMAVRVQIESDCAHVRRLANALPETINAFEELFKPLCANVVMQLAEQHLAHRACVVPAGALKAVEAAAGLALPTDVEIKLRRTE